MQSKTAAKLGIPHVEGANSTKDCGKMLRSDSPLSDGKICFTPSSLAALDCPSPPAAFGTASGRAPSPRPTLWQGYKAVVPRRFSVNSVNSFSSLFILATSRASGLGRSSTSPRPFPAGPRPRRDIRRSQSEECRPATAGCYSLEVSAALSHQLPSCGSPLGDDEGYR
jgi:hypothetical protein